MEWQQDQDPEISVEDVFEITLDVKPETTFEGDLEYVEDSEGEDYPIFPPPSQKLLQQQPLYIPDEAMESEPYMLRQKLNICHLNLHPKTKICT